MARYVIWASRKICGRPELSDQTTRPGTGKQSQLPGGAWLTPSPGVDGVVQMIRNDVVVVCMCSCNERPLLPRGGRVGASENAGVCIARATIGDRSLSFSQATEPKGGTNIQNGRNHDLNTGLNGCTTESQRHSKDRREEICSQKDSKFGAVDMPPRSLP